MARSGRRTSSRRPAAYWRSRRRKACREAPVLKSVQLTLMMGPIIPVTVPRVVLDSLASVEVQVEDVGQSGFQLIFSIDKQSPLQILFLLTGGLPLLFMRCILVATINGVGNGRIARVVTTNTSS